MRVNGPDRPAFPEAEVALGDLSYDALEVAWQNIERHDLEDRVYTVQGDGFAGLKMVDTYLSEGGQQA